MSYKYFLPDRDGKRQVFETDKQALIIVGANGSGKSHLGAWIEQQNNLCLFHLTSSPLMGGG